MKLLKNVFVALLLTVTAIGCAQQEAEETKKKEMAEPATKHSQAVAVVHATAGNEVSGTVTFTKKEKGVRVQADLSGLSEGKHGFHVHQYGDCRADDGTSAGGHYNPADNKHAGPDAESRHVGDMGNIEADADGNATIDYMDSTIELNGADSIIGRGVVLHGGADDLESQPSGAAGPRVGCGVVGIANTGM
ncbi:superoxide dismutase family protein [Fodinibius halophilus]|uniref:Superoxide dismutase family protein n=1 Tax=Fodinibius halophilus TaxID=1736908 RepID=A0A6M1T157_9BACT|nr:superoxide dismutase family protein [Fodinibius halophilus]NGP89818.1 superoxide dismutase family protein [Fodinibius halophilus]